MNLHDVFKATKVKEIMETPVVSVNVNSDMSEAEEKFVVHGITHLPVVDDNNKVVGMLSRKYLYKAQSPRRFIEGEAPQALDTIIDGDSYYRKETLDRYILKNIMHQNPYVINAEATAQETVSLMARKKVGCISVVDDKQNLLGILTNQEIVNFIADLLAQ